ncbi:hypothetical protein C0Q70_11327 [Pomacea canaliculata]|uniref:C1q domain-containing protein n=1 Tax=Pomacea canaliculata TaxID=400727 RepID=A0A2T7P5R9_POMCA|nr:hypothetical protein C0Q70_11327 [Pomacea canaliculata]
MKGAEASTNSADESRVMPVVTFPRYHVAMQVTSANFTKHDNQRGPRGRPETSYLPLPNVQSEYQGAAGGVTQFQTNFYLSDKILTCDVCNRGQEATYSCTDCGQSMCDECQQWHYKFLSSHEVQPLTSGCQQSSEKSLDPDCLEKLNKHLKVLEAALVRMREEEDTLQRERQAIADVISRRADAVRALVTQAEVRKPDGAGRRRVTVAFRQGQEHLSDEDFRYFQQRCSRKRFLHHFSSCIIELETVASFLGTVSGDEEDIEDTGSILSATVRSDSKDTERTEDIDTVESVKDENSKLQMDVAALKEQLSSIQQSSILSKDISSIQKDMASLQEKQIGDNTMLQKDIATIREISSQHGREMKKFQCDFINLVKDLKSFKEKSCYMVAFHAELKQTMETNWEWKPIILEADNCNLGQAYDTKTGVFTAPVAGTYFFMARTVRNEGSGYCSLAISVERCKTTSSLSHYGKLQAGVGCTVHVVQRLTPGQTVSLMGYGRAKLPGCATCFSGMLVRPDIELAQS